MSKKEINMDIEKRKLNIIHKFLKLTPKEQQQFLDKAKVIKDKVD